MVPLPTYNTFLPIMGETPAIIKPLTANGSKQPVLVVQTLAVGLYFLINVISQFYFSDCPYGGEEFSQPVHQVLGPLPRLD